MPFDLAKCALWDDGSSSFVWQKLPFCLFLILPVICCSSFYLCESVALTEKLKTLVTKSRKGGEATAKPYYGQPACMGIELTRIFESNAEESDDQTTQEIDGECSQRNETDTVGL